MIDTSGAGTYDPRDVRFSAADPACFDVPSCVSRHRSSRVTIATAHGPSDATVGRSWLRRAGPLVLILGSACSAPLFKVSTITFSGDRLLGLAATAVVAVLLARGRLQWTGVHSALAAFVAVQVLTTSINATRWPQGPKFVTIYLLGFSCFALAAEWALGADGQRRMARSWIVVAAILSVAGTVAAALANLYQQELWGTGGAQLLFRHTARPRVLFAARATAVEWNLFSSFVMIPFTLALWAWRRDGGGQRGLIAAIGAMVFGLVFGVTRAAWLSMAGIAALWCWARRPRWQQVGVLALMVALAFLFQASVIGTSPVESRVVQPVRAGYDWTVVGRLSIGRVTIKSWLERPLTGHGAGSNNRLSVTLATGYRPLEKVWNGNIVLFLLHDSGLLGLAALAGLGLVVGRRAVGAIRHGSGRSSPSLAVPLFAAGAVLCFAYQFTHGLWLMYPYVYLGFLTAATGRGADGA